MDARTVIFYILNILCIPAVLVRICKCAHPFRCLLLSVSGGIAALFAVNASGIFTGVCLGVNPYTVSVSAAGGVPGVIMLLVLRTLCL